jgi:hypothetical protein
MYCCTCNIHLSPVKGLRKINTNSDMEFVPKCMRFGWHKCESFGQSCSSSIIASYDEAKPEVKFRPVAAVSPSNEIPQRR